MANFVSYVVCVCHTPQVLLTSSVLRTGYVYADALDSWAAMS